LVITIRAKVIDQYPRLIPPEGRYIDTLPNHHPLYPFTNHVQIPETTHRRRPTKGHRGR
jgi:hypothetical protein